MPAVVWSDNNRVDGAAKTGVGYARQVGGLSAFAPAVTTGPATAPRPVVPPAAPPAARPGGDLAATGMSPLLHVGALEGFSVATDVRALERRVRNYSS
jgi:hypothetical protein